MTHPQILIHEMSFNLPTGKALFSKLSLAFATQKVGLVGGQWHWQINAYQADNGRATSFLWLDTN